MPSDYDNYQANLDKAAAAADQKANKWSNDVGAYGGKVDDLLSGAITTINPFANAAQTAEGGFTTAGSPIPGGVAGVAWGCGSCPDFVLGVLADDCRDTLRRVREVKTITTIINRLVTDVAAQLVNDLRALASLIPYPPVLDISAIVRMLTCPLTPQAILLQQAADVLAYCERAAAGTTNIAAHYAAYNAAFGTYTATAGTLLATLDPRALVNRIVKLITAFIRQLRLLVDTFLEQMKGAAYVQLIYRYIGELFQVINSLEHLGLRIALTSISVAGVRSTCPALYERTDLPFKTYTTTLVDFTFDGILPSGLDAAAIDIATVFMEIEAKIALWGTVGMLLL